MAGWAHERLPPAVGSADMGRLTGSQIDALGRRLRDGAAIADGDLDLLQELLDLHIPPLQYVNDRLAALGLNPHSRLKSTGTIIDKLRRERITLRGIHDLAGTRVVKQMTLGQQDDLTARVAALFPESRVIDRRASPNHGYRAVHVAARLQGRWVEIQLRTDHQDAWAQLMERFADRVGREVRYGQLPDALASGTMADVQLRELLVRLMDLSRVIARREEVMNAGGESPDDAMVDELVRRVRVDLGLPPPD